MEIIKKKDGTKLSITLVGNLDTTTSSELEGAVMPELDGVEETVFDFEKLNYISSAGLRILLMIQKKLGKRNKMIIKNVNDIVMDVFKVTGFDNILTIENGTDHEYTKLSTDDISKKIREVAERLDISIKDRNALRLLAEEMISMTANLLKGAEASVDVKEGKNGIELHLRAKARVGWDEKDAFVSVSTKKENIKEKGIKGKIMSVFEDFFYAQTSMPADAYIVDDTLYGYSIAWSMNNYMSIYTNSYNADYNDNQEEWDGLEKSVITAFADDVIIGVRHDEVEMIVTKKI